MPDAVSQVFQRFFRHTWSRLPVGLCLNAVSSDLPSIINEHTYNLKAAPVHTAYHNCTSTLVIKFANGLVDTNHHHYAPL
jgi:hypothetical protein